MALIKSKDVPKDAVVLNEHEAINYIWDIVSQWDSLWDTWALRFGPGVLGGINALSGVIITNHYRRKLKLGTYGYLSSIIPVTVMPGILTATFHRQIISTNMLLMKNDSCPLCYEVRSALLQLTLGIVYPMVLGPLSSLMFANRYSTYRVPDMVEGPKVMFKFLRKLTRPLTGTLTLLATAQFVASSLMTYCEMRNNLTLRHKLVEIENKIMSQTETTQ